VLARFAPNWHLLSHDLSKPRDWVGRVGADSAAITLTSALMWVAACWLSCGLLAAAASTLPGKIGGLGTAVSERIMPAALRRVVIGAAGVSLLLTPAQAMAEGASSTTTPTPAATETAVAWPLDQSSVVPIPNGSSAQAEINWPTDVARSIVNSSPSETTHMPPSAKPPVLATITVPVRSAPAGANLQAQQVTVQPGDSLWLIAAHRLGPDATDAQIAAEWPAWYGANKQVVGDNANLLLPGQHLSTPDTSTRNPEDH
jgi:LysM repeat protein